jgi:hypothetical protein
MDFGDHEAMRRAALVLLAACGGPALHNVQLVNKTPRTIAEVYLFPAGSANHGASRGSLAPNATLAVKMKGGNVEVLAISEKVKVNQTESETKQASSTIQLVRPVSLIFHDSDQPAPAFEDKSSIGVTFRIDKQPEPAPPAE